MMDLWQNFEGTMGIELTSASLSDSMAVIQKAQISVWDVENRDDLTIRFCIRRRSFTKLCSLLEKRGDVLTVLDQQGIYWSLLSLKKRPVLVCGLLFLLILSLWVPGRVFFVQVQGNASIDTRRIVHAASDCGITFGAKRREVRSEKMKNALMEAIPELSWAGINTYGCTAVISVREKEEKPPKQEQHVVSSVIAARDGIIRQITVLQGNGLCMVGQAVSAGQVLISGYTDCGISIRATQAKGDVFAETNRQLTAVCPQSYTYRGQILHEEKKYSLIIGKKRINFSNNSGISGTGCAKIYEENYLALPGGFILPVAIAVETRRYYETEETTMQMDLQAAAGAYLLQQMCAGSILRGDTHLQEAEGVLILRGSYACYEMIGITRIEESMLDYVEND